jgi:acid phosphatase type 7
MEKAEKYKRQLDTQNYKTPVFKKNQPDDNFKFRSLPKPTGTYPYHLNLQDILPFPEKEKMTFHILGDTGSMRNPDFIRHVVAAMESQYQPSASNEAQPQFLYHLGDIVYNHGEASQYRKQFFEPYQHYPAPIFAIAGNHDSDVNPESETGYDSLDAFKAVFCDTESQIVSFSGNAQRKSQQQPNIYWTLKTPLANIIGMHSNVPKFGIVTPEQRSWLVGELITADRDRPHKALILCIHHSPYSADTNHGSSLPMINLLESVFAETGVRPDVVFSGHVHNYQRFTKHYTDGKSVPFIVAGAGGYDELHTVALKNDPNFTSEKPEFDSVRLEKYCDDQHGFLKISIERNNGQLTLGGKYYTIPQVSSFRYNTEPEPNLGDHFSIILQG